MTEFSPVWIDLASASSCVCSDVSMAAGSGSGGGSGGRGSGGLLPLVPDLPRSASLSRSVLRRSFTLRARVGFSLSYVVGVDLLSSPRGVGVRPPLEPLDPPLEPLDPPLDPLRGPPDPLEPLLSLQAFLSTGGASL